VNGIRAKWHECVAVIQDYDVAVITESKLDENATHASLSIAGYQLFRQDRSRHGGGVAVYVANGLRPEALLDMQKYASSNGLEAAIVSISLLGKKSKVTLLGLYRPPSSRAAWFESFNELILKLIQLGPLIILGDLNCDLRKPALSPVKSLLASLALAGTIVPETLATRVTELSATSIDIIAIDKNIPCLDYYVSDNSASDHSPVVAIIKGSAIDRILPVHKRSFKKVDFNELHQRIAAIDIQDHGSDSVDVMLDSWHNRVIQILDDVAPMKPYPWRKNKLPWLNQGIRDLMTKRDVISKTIASKTLGLEDAASAVKEVQELRRRIKSRIRRGMKDAGRKALESQDHKGAWKYIRAATFTTPKGSDARFDLGEMNDHFARTVQSVDNEVIEDVASCDLEDSFAFQAVSTYRVAALLETVKTSTATGPDEIPGFLVRKLATAMAPAISVILNTSFESRSFPAMWKRANICPVWKGKGSKKDVSNYRPISILPVLARVCEKIAANQLYEYCSRKELIPPEQFGFRRKSSCETALISALDSWIASVDAGEMVGALLIDLSRAFDTVPHKMLIHELASSGCGTDALQWFASYLSQRLQRVVQKSNTAEWRPVSRGVPQGSCLSPLLFNIFVRELPAANQLTTKQFADDITGSIASANPAEIVQKLTEGFNHTKEFCDAHELVINANKTQLVIFKAPSKPSPDNMDLTLDGCLIKPVTSVQLLGVTLDSHLTLASHIDNTIRKAHGLLGALARAAPLLPRQLLKQAYTALIRSRLEYCSAILAPVAKTHLNKLDVIQRSAARIICGVPRDTHAAPLLDELGLQSLECRRNKHIIGIVRSILENECHPALQEMFKAGTDGRILTPYSPRTALGAKRFSCTGATIFNADLEARSGGLGGGITGNAGGGTEVGGVGVAGVDAIASVGAGAIGAKSVGASMRDSIDGDATPLSHG